MISDAHLAVLAEADMYNLPLGMQRPMRHGADLAVFAIRSSGATVNLALQVASRYSSERPMGHLGGNMVRFFNILEVNSNFLVKRMICVSCSPFCGGNSKISHSGGLRGLTPPRGLL